MRSKYERSLSHGWWMCFWVSQRFCVLTYIKINKIIWLKIVHIGLSGCNETDSLDSNNNSLSFLIGNIFTIY